MKYFVTVVIGVVAVAVIAGIVIVGSPADERLRKLDAQRVGDLQNIQGAIMQHWQAKRALPATLGDIRYGVEQFISPKDPATGEEYAYAAKGDLNFELCADFSLGTDGTIPFGSAVQPVPAYDFPQGKFGIETNWDHAAGHVCFDRTIDKDFYPPIGVQK